MYPILVNTKVWKCTGILSPPQCSTNYRLVFNAWVMYVYKEFLMRQADKLKYADSISEIKIKRMSTGYSEEIFPHEEEYEDYDDSMATFFF